MSFPELLNINDNRFQACAKNGSEIHVIEKQGKKLLTVIKILGITYCTLPALPLLCLELARATHSGWRVWIFISLSKFESLILPLSTTYTTSSMVMDVSAIFVARITWKRFLWGMKLLKSFKLNTILQKKYFNKLDILVPSELQGEVFEKLQFGQFLVTRNAVGKSLLTGMEAWKYDLL